jgi:hypothetical protein
MHPPTVDKLLCASRQINAILLNLVSNGYYSLFFVYWSISTLNKIVQVWLLSVKTQCERPQFQPYLYRERSKKLWLRRCWLSLCLSFGLACFDISFRYITLLWSFYCKLNDSLKGKTKRLKKEAEKLSLGDYRQRNHSQHCLFAKYVKFNIYGLTARRNTRKHRTTWPHFSRTLSTHFIKKLNWKRPTIKSK